MVHHNHLQHDVDHGCVTFHLKENSRPSVESLPMLTSASNEKNNKCEESESLENGLCNKGIFFRVAMREKTK